jgi:hypothetical protein
MEGSDEFEIGDCPPWLRHLINLGSRYTAIVIYNWPVQWQMPCNGSSKYIQQTRLPLQRMAKANNWGRLPGDPIHTLRV